MNQWTSEKAIFSLLAPFSLFLLEKLQACDGCLPHNLLRAGWAIGVRGNKMKYKVFILAATTPGRPAGARSSNEESCRSSRNCVKTHSFIEQCVR
uniref:Putative secreted protein n=1 Tax=Anopheles marajoara TaxID=58244 RepID=A0A2M4C9B3_9DIPT